MGNNRTKRRDAGVRFMGMHVVRRAAGVVLCALLAVPALPGSGVASPVCESVWVKSYDVSLEVARKTYRAGDTARVDATVTRKDTGTPVAGVKLVAIVPYRKALILDVAKTDSAGRAVAELELKRKHVQPGPARLIGIAYEEVADTTCATVVEYGEKRIRKAFVVRP
jgi:hypothetical protein